jgi:hypothetical protein
MELLKDENSFFEQQMFAPKRHGRGISQAGAGFGHSFGFEADFAEKTLPALPTPDWLLF